MNENNIIEKPFYPELIDNPKMAKLPDKIWRRLVELFLIAKVTTNDGNLPNAESLAWKLRVPLSEIIPDLLSLEENGFIQKISNTYFIKNYQEWYIFRKVDE